MVTLEQVLNEVNIATAIENMHEKNSDKENGISEIREYWDINSEDILEMLRGGKYEPSRVQQFELLKPDGRRRIVSNYAPVDRLILRAIEQVLRVVIEPICHDNCYSYRHGKGYIRAAAKAADYIEEGYIWVAEMDIAHYFDNINLSMIMELIRPLVDEPLYQLIYKYLYCTVEYDYEVREINLGLIQGNSLSPILSNLFLNEYDWKVAGDWKFVRFSDNINVYTKTRDEALEAYNISRDYLKSIGLALSYEKSGVFEALKRRFLGYQFNENKRNHKITVSRYKERKQELYHRWHRTSIQNIGKNYHLINDGILSRQDYNILFENDEGKHILPVEVVESINIYSNVTFSTDFFAFANERRLRINLFDRYGECVGNYYSSAGDSNALIMKKQVEVYNDEIKRFELAKKIENAIMHNLRANLRYYKKHSEKTEYDDAIDTLTGIMTDINEAKNMEQLMLVEARGRQLYFKMFKHIVNNPDFEFKERTRRPPKDAINALISFGNVFVYNRVATEIRKSSLDIRVGIIHATNRRQESLNLDVADIFKPIIVDRVIFSMINKQMIDAKEHFTYSEDSVFLNQEGKRMFIRELEDKLRTTVTVKDKRLTYEALLREEVKKIHRAIVKGEKYRPYKYT